MKMEFPVLAPSDGTVLQVRCKEGSGVTAVAPRPGKMSS
ncbi:biotin/lipoyl-containing protein [Aquabacterium sp.]